jgi:hypothetical protein
MFEHAQYSRIIRQDNYICVSLYLYNFQFFISSCLHCNENNYEAHHHIVMLESIVFIKLLLGMFLDIKPSGFCLTVIANEE